MEENWWPGSRKLSFIILLTTTSFMHYFKHVNFQELIQRLHKTHKKQINREQSFSKI